MSLVSKAELVQWICDELDIEPYQVTSMSNMTLRDLRELLKTIRTMRENNRNLLREVVNRNK